VTLAVPWYGGGMSFGSVSLNTILSRVRTAVRYNTLMSTGEGGYPEDLHPYDHHVVTQVATGLFGVREDTIQRVRMVEFKYAQGAKPGLGGHLLGDKVTPAVARMRESVTGSALFSPFPFHSVYSVEDHKKHLDWIKEVNPRALVSVKVSTPTDVDMVAVGSYYAGAHVVQLDGSYGGTGAAPDIAKKNIAMPIEFAIPKVHQFLQQEGIRDQVTLIASGGIRTAYDVAKIMRWGPTASRSAPPRWWAWNACAATSARAAGAALGASPPPTRNLVDMMTVDWGTKRLCNMYHAWTWQLKEILRRFGMRSIRELVGRTDTLVHLDYYNLPVDDDVRRGGIVFGFLVFCFGILGSKFKVARLCRVRSTHRITLSIG
jgi:glutamate synthase domain-containing protein 2